MFKICPICKNKFEAKRRDSTFCSRKCLYKDYNDKRPRKTDKSYIKANHLRGKHIPQNQLEIIYGTLIGDGSLILQTNNFHRLSFCHSEKQLEYLKYKKKLLDSIFIQTKCNKYINKNNIQYHSHSISHKDLTNIFGLSHRNKKKYITRKFLNLLTPTSLLFWYIDDGSMIKGSGNAIVLCTDSFSLSENKAMKIWLWQKFRVNSSVMQVKGSFSDKLYHRLRMNKENTIRFLHVLNSSIYFKELLNIMSYKFYPYYVI